MMSMPAMTSGVTATVTSEYGFTGISILRALNDDETKVKEEGAWLSTNKTDTEKRYSGTIGKEKAGTKVTFQILAVSAYGVYTFSEVYEYTVQEETDPEPMPNPRSELIYTLYNNMELKEILAISASPDFISM